MNHHHQEGAASGPVQGLARAAIPADGPALVKFSAIFWVVVFVLAVAQAKLGLFGFDLAQLGVRALIHLIGFSICLGLGLLMQRTARFSLAQQAAAVFLVCIPVGGLYSVLDTLIWQVGAPQADPLSDAPFLDRLALRLLARILLLLLWCSMFLAFQYASELVKRERSLLEARALAREAQLRMLQYQISPHFLFNTLNALSGLVVTGRTQDAEEMIGRLSRFLRTTFMTDTAEKVKLSEEMRLELEYLQIEGIRFGERLRIETSINDEAAEALVPHLILQPLLENAIKHGVARSDEPVAVSVTAHRDGKNLIVMVSNDGTHGQQQGRAGVGLANVRARLASHYGNEASMSVDSLSDRRFNVTLQLPLELTL